MEMTQEQSQLLEQLLAVADALAKRGTFFNSEVRLLSRSGFMTSAREVLSNARNIAGDRSMHKDMPLEGDGVITDALHRAESESLIGWPDKNGMASIIEGKKSLDVFLHTDSKRYDDCK